MYGILKPVSFLVSRNPTTHPTDKMVQVSPNYSQFPSPTA